MSRHCSQSYQQGALCCALLHVACRWGGHGCAPPECSRACMEKKLTHSRLLTAPADKHSIYAIKQPMRILVFLRGTAVTAPEHQPRLKRATPLPCLHVGSSVMRIASRQCDVVTPAGASVGPRV